MSLEINYTLNAQLADNTVTRDDLTDKILTPVSAGTADKQRVISEIMAMNPGLERETVAAVIDLEQRAIEKLLLTGYRVNTGLYQAGVQFTGVVTGGTFDSAVNTVYVAFQQGAALREAIRENTTVNVIGEKGSAIYIAGGSDSATGTSGFTATAGSIFTLKGKMLKIAGDDPTVGITLTDSEGTVTKIAAGAIAVNMPSKLSFIIPAGLADGEYTLTVTTQYNIGRNLIAPRSVSQMLTIGKTTSDSGTSGSGDSSSGNEDNPLV